MEIIPVNSGDRINKIVDQIYTKLPENNPVSLFPQNTEEPQINNDLLFQLLYKE